VLAVAEHNLQCVVIWYKYIALCSDKNNISSSYHQEVTYSQLLDDWTYFRDLLLESNPAHVHLHRGCKPAVLRDIQVLGEAVQRVYFYPDRQHLPGVSIQRRWRTVRSRWSVEECFC